MKRENIEKQTAIVDELMSLVHAKANELFMECNTQTAGLLTNEANELYNSEFAETQKVLYEVVTLLAVRYYELGQIKR